MKIVKFGEAVVRQTCIRNSLFGTFAFGKSAFGEKESVFGDSFGYPTKVWKFVGNILKVPWTLLVAFVVK